MQTLRLLAGRYQVGDLIGRGGMADVHVGTDTRLGRRVAIKLLKPSLATDPAFRSRFRREAQDAAKMAHPTIVRIFDAGEETVRGPNGQEAQLPYIIMEYVDGRLLKDMIAAGPMNPGDAVRIIEQVLTALEYSHRAGVVHRDIKPGNIMVTATGQVKVMDFGIARAISESSATIAETSTIVGTAQYFSPEQARGEAVDARTDLYSTGIVLFEMLTGRAPFRGENPVAVAYQHVNQLPAPPSTLNSDVSPALDAVVLRGVAKDRFERYQSAADFREDAAAAGAGNVVAKRTPASADFSATLFGVNPTATAGSEATLRQLTADESDRSVRTQSRPPVAWIWGGVTIMAVIIVAVVVWTLSLSPTALTGNIAIAVPEVQGFTWENGSAALIEAKLDPTRVDEVSDTVAEGVIISTDPSADVTVSPGQSIRVNVSSGPEQLQVPQLAGMTSVAANEALGAIGLSIGTITQAYSTTVKADTVMSSIPVAGERLRADDTVDVVVSNGLVQVPVVTGKNIGDATRELGSLQLVVKTVGDTSCSGGTVSSQSITGDQPQKSEITVSYCSKP
jgi:serine/threonine-protein kinase